MKAKAIISAGIVISLLSTGANLFAHQDAGSSQSPDQNQNSQNDTSNGNNNWSSQGATGNTMNGQSAGSFGQSSAQNNQTPPAIDRASNLIGMRIRNGNNQTLGTISDVVFDFQSGRISYVVVKKAGRTHGSGEFAAVPLSAFTPSSDMRHLTLNTDRNQLQSTQGFSRNNYPPTGEPAYGAQPRQQERTILIVPIVPRSPGQNQNQNDQNEPNTPDENRGPNQNQNQDQDQPVPQQQQNPSTPTPQ